MFLNKLGILYKKILATPDIPYNFARIYQILMQTSQKSMICTAYSENMLDFLPVFIKNWDLHQLCDVKTPLI